MTNRKIYTLSLLFLFIGLLSFKSYAQGPSPLKKYTISGKVLEFRKAGNKLLLVEPNQNYRAITSNQAEKNSVKEAFAESVIFGFEIKETKDSTYIIDLTPFLMQDAHGVSEKLKKGKFGSYSLDKSKSALSMDRLKPFQRMWSLKRFLHFQENLQEEQ